MIGIPRRATALAVAALLAMTAAVVRRHRTIAAVAPQLRTRALWLPLFVDNRLSLAIGRRMFDLASEPVTGVTVARHGVPGGQDVFVYEPEDWQRPGGALLWIHGGGTILGRPEGDHELCSRIARDAGIQVVSVRYRLAPEHPFPGGFEDCYAALRWLHEHARELGVDDTRIAVGGASAGGGLAAAVVQKAHDEALPVAFQALVYPMLDDRTAARRDHDGRGRIAWTPRSNRYAWTSYLGRRPGIAEPPPYAAAGRRLDLTGLPPAWIGVGDLDLFHDEDLAYARRLDQAGVSVDLVIEPGMYHAAELELHTTVPAMHAFQQAMIDALAARIGSRATSS